MKDLYQRLSLPSVCNDPDELRHSITTCGDEAVAEAAEYILLNEERKKIYDRQHQLLSIIGKLRSELMLPLSTDWEALGNQDFDCEDVSASPPDLMDVLDDPTLNMATRAPRQQLQSRNYSTPVNARVVAYFGIAAGLIGLIAIIAASLMSTPQVIMPTNGHVEHFVERPADCNLRIRNPSEGHAFLEFSDYSGRRIFSVLVCEQMDATIIAPKGDYKVRCQKGSAADWNGNGFDGATPRKPKKLPLSPAKKTSFTIKS
jgi:hypothetical protein